MRRHNTGPEACIPIASDSVTRRLSAWVSLLARFFWLQAAAQVLAIASGLLAVRALDVGAFALLTVAFAVQATMALLADSGVTQSLLARAGAVAGERRQFSRVVETAVALRRRFQAAALAIGLPVLVVVLRAYEVDWQECAFAAVALTASLYGNVKQTVYATVLFLQLRPSDAQRAAVQAGLVRFGVTLAAFVLVSNWVVFLCISAGASLLQGWLVERSARGHLDAVNETSPEDRAAMIVAFRNQLLNGIYFAFQPQITVWILTVFGTVQRIAEIGALARLSLAFAIVSAAFSGLLLPRFARYQDPAVVRQRYLVFSAATVVVGAAALTTAWLFPRPILLLLGHGYLHLERELLWVIGASAISLVSAAVHLMNSARGWVRGIWLGVPATIVMQVLLARFVDLGTVHGAILIQASAFIAPMAINITIGVRGMRGAHGAARG